jgi:homocitrate synthase NifV
MAGLAFNTDKKLKIARYLDSLNIYQIEAGTAAMGGEEKESIYKIKSDNLKSKISSWNRLKLEDIQHSMDCGVDIIHISAPSSYLQLVKKLNRDEDWLKDSLKSCIYYCKERGFDVTIGFEDASRANFEFLCRLCILCIEEGVSRVRYSDTVGVLTPSRTFKAINKLRSIFNLEIEIHAHNDFGMALANSLTAINAGASFVDCTLEGIGERAGNCDYFQFVKAFSSINNERF